MDARPSAGYPPRMFKHEMRWMLAIMFGPLLIGLLMAPFLPMLTRHFPHVFRRELPPVTSLDSRP